MGLLSALGKNGARIFERPWAQPLNAASPVGESLTRMQRHILELLANGVDEAAIARGLGADPRFVTAIASRANGKVGARGDYRGWSDGLLPPGFF